MGGKDASIALPCHTQKQSACRGHVRCAGGPEAPHSPTLTRYQPVTGRYPSPWWWPGLDPGQLVSLESSGSPMGNHDVAGGSIILEVISGAPGDLARKHRHPPKAP